MTIPPNPHPEQVEMIAEDAWARSGLEVGDWPGFWAGWQAHAASLANRPADDGELERLREYHAATEEMVCVWRDTNDASSMDEEAWDNPSDEDTRWQRFAAARLALLPPQPEGVKRP